MTITAAIVVFAVTWFMVFFCVLPLRFQSQGEAGVVVPGTPKSAPSSENVGKKARITTVVAAILSAVICAVILSGWISVKDFDFRGTMDQTPP